MNCWPTMPVAPRMPTSIIDPSYSIISLTAMLQSLFHAWERRLAAVSKDRVVRPFEWGLDWMPQNGHRAGAAAPDAIARWVAQVMADTEQFFTPPPSDDYRLIRGGD